jgi:hypothetical protein
MPSARRFAFVVMKGLIEGAPWPAGTPEGILLLSNWVIGRGP